MRFVLKKSEKKIIKYLAAQVKYYTALALKLNKLMILIRNWVVDGILYDFLENNDEKCGDYLYYSIFQWFLKEYNVL